MVGLDQITSDQIRDQRKSEIEASVKSRMLMVATAIGSMFTLRRNFNNSI